MQAIFTCLTSNAVSKKNGLKLVPVGGLMFRSLLTQNENFDAKLKQFDLVWPLLRVR